MQAVSLKVKKGRVMMIRNFILVVILLQTCTFFAKDSIIILYGCSSAGKTSIAAELLRILPGKWKYVPANRFAVVGGNALLWDHINETVRDGYDVIVDTHNSRFFIDDIQNRHVIVTLLYCSPEKLIEHVTERNSKNNSGNHRKLKTVFKEYCQKFKSVKKGQPHIDTLQQDVLKNNYGFLVTFALKRIINQFFTAPDQRVAYIAPLLAKYDCFINTGKTSIFDSAQKIKRELMLLLNS